MVTFKNNIARENALGGFRTNNPNSVFEGNLAEGNAGPGFLDDSGQIFAKVEEEIRAAKFDEAEREGALQLLTEMQNEQHKPGYLALYERFSSLVANHATLVPYLPALARYFVG